MQLRIVEDPQGFVVEWFDDSVAVWKEAGVFATQIQAEQAANGLDRRNLAVDRSARVVWTND